MTEQKKIFIVEDEKPLANALKIALDQFDYDVVLVFDGELAYDLIIKEKPDLILLDILMPKVFGIELLEKIRKSSDKSVSQIPVVIITNYPETQYKEKAKKLGVKDFVTKSQVSVSEMVDIAKKNLNN